MPTAPKSYRAHAKPKHSALPINGNGRLYDKQRWRKLRIRIRYRDPVCVKCGVAPSTDIDHIIAHQGNLDLFWDEENLQGTCKSCHSRKTVQHDGGFGRSAE